MQIIFTGDVRRRLPQSTNIRWLWHLLGAPISALTGQQPECWDFSSETVSDEQTARESVSDDRGWHFQKRDLKGKLVIGFELPKYFKNQADREGVKYIDFVIHPVRFLDDICFGVRTNFFDPELFRLADDEIRNGSSIISAASEFQAGVQLSDNCGVFFGQTDIDKSLMIDGSLRRVNDYKDKIVELSRRHSQFLIKTHPNGSEEVRRFFKSIPNASLVKGVETYWLLSRRQVTGAYAMSSSVVAEAEWFGKKAEALIPVWWNDLTIIHPKVALSRSFWKRIIPSDMIKNDVQDVNFWYPNLLRATADSWWGYAFYAKRR